MHFDQLLQQAALIGKLPLPEQATATMQFPANWCQ